MMKPIINKKFTYAKYHGGGGGVVYVIDTSTVKGVVYRAFIINSKLKPKPTLMIVRNTAHFDIEDTNVYVPCSRAEFFSILRREWEKANETIS